MTKLLDKAILILITLFLIAPFLSNETTYQVSRYGQIPVLQGGRIKPLDSIARNSLLAIQGKQTVRTEDKKLTPIEWLLEVQTNPKKTDTYPIFLIEHPELFSFLGEKYYKQKYRVSFDHLIQYNEYIMGQAKEAEALKSAERTPLQQEFATLKKRMMLYMQLKNTLSLETVNSLRTDIKTFQKNIPKSLQSIEEKDSTTIELVELNYYFKQFKLSADNAYFAVIPPITKKSSSEDWSKLGNAILKTLAPNNVMNPAIMHIATLRDSYKKNDIQTFNTTIDTYHNYLKQNHSKVFRKARLEFAFNKIEFFYKSTLLYGIAILLTLLFWATRHKNSYQIARQIFYITFAIYTIGLLLRMIIQGRPPVTNLYSSAIFVGWVAVGFSIFIEKLQRNGLGILIGSIIGFSTLIIAHFLSLSGDTLEMMQAVLDSNFWLSTHVVTITMGYSGVFLAGLIAHIYILGGFITTRLSKTLQKSLTTLCYGSICTALLLSFIGTVLGGIWGDQSWGRFWGWDPKENGAILIVLWMGIILHARMAGWIKQRGLMVMAVFGNIVCSFSWFGVNLLGIGLHAYGFTEKGFFYLVSFCLIQATVMIIGSIPTKIWRSHIR